MSPGARRILLTVDAVGGVWQYGLDLARGLAVRGCEVVLAVLGPLPDGPQRAEVSISGVTLVETGLALDWLSDGPAPVALASAAIAQLARDFGVDIVQLNSPTLAAAGGFPAPVIAVNHGCVATWWEAANPGVPLAPQFLWHRDLMAEGLRIADRVVTPTASYAAIVARRYDLTRKIEVVHNGRTPLLANQNGALHDRVLTVGRLWDKVKRVELLDRTAGWLAIPFEAAGNPVAPHGERVELEHLHLLGQLDSGALGRRLASRPVFVSAASFEPFGLSVLEAASAGCALVLSDIGSFRELWDGAALFVSGDDEGAYADAIESLIGDVAQRLRLGEAARRRSAHYTPQAMADAMLDIYAEVLAGRVPREAASVPQGNVAA
jgi:glycosyltransferase involved in cell wall biosynthesis